MIRLTSVVAGILCIGFLANMGASQDKKDDKGTDKKMKGQLPPGWKALNLTADQKKQVYSIQSDYNAKIKALQEQISQLKAKEFQDMVKVLTEQQRAQLAKGLIPDEPKKDKAVEPKKDKAPEDKKSDK